MQHASVSQGRICLNNCTCCHTEIEVADQAFYPTQSQYTDAGPTRHSADPITPGAWQGSHWSANFEVNSMTRPRKIPAEVGFEPRIFRSWGGRLINEANEVVDRFRLNCKAIDSKHEQWGVLISIRRMRFTTQWRAALRLKSFKVVVVRGELGWGGRGGWRLEITGGGATSQRCWYLGVGGGFDINSSGFLICVIFTRGRASPLSTDLECQFASHLIWLNQSYQWLTNWHSSGYPAIRLAL